MDRFLELKVYVAVAEESGFAPAARRLQMSPPAVTRAIAGLERRLGIQLLNRTTRHVRVTAAGEHYLEHARKILNELAAADAAVLGTHAAPAGSLSITAPVQFGKKFVVPGVVDYLSRYPQTQVTFALLDRVVNLLEEGFDIGVRIGELPDSTMRAIAVGKLHWVVCASPEYLSERSVPVDISGLASHSVVVIGESTSNTRWTFVDAGKTKSIQLNPRFSVNNVDAALTAAKLGYGFARLLSYQVADALAEGSLVRVLAEFDQTEIPVHIIHREGRVGTALARGFIDLMVERLRAEDCLQAKLV